MPRTTRKPTYARDSDHKEIVLVPLANHSEPAKILVEDFEAVLAAGYTERWTFNQTDRAGKFRYVRCSAWERRGNLVSVARLILDPPPGRIVKYRDGNRLNLRRDNLMLARRHTKGVTLKDEAAGATA